MDCKWHSLSIASHSMTMCVQWTYSSVLSASQRKNRCTHSDSILVAFAIRSLGQGSVLLDYRVFGDVRTSD